MTSRTEDLVRSFRAYCKSVGLDYESLVDDASRALSRNHEPVDLRTLAAELAAQDQEIFGDRIS